MDYASSVDQEKKIIFFLIETRAGPYINSDMTRDIVLNIDIVISALSWTADWVLVNPSGRVERKWARAELNLYGPSDIIGPRKELMYRCETLRNLGSWVHLNHLDSCLSHPVENQDSDSGWISHLGVICRASLRLTTWWLPKTISI